jgi:hypothetical protein
VVPEVVAIEQRGSVEAAQPAPGQLTRHYAPRAALTLFEGLSDAVVACLGEVRT